MIMDGETGSDDRTCQKSLMSYSPAEGCACYVSESFDVNQFTAHEGNHMFTLTPIVETPLVQSPRVVKDQAYCANFHNLGNTDTVD